MAYRTECKKTVKEFGEILKNFLTNPVSMDEVDYSNATGNGNIENINFNYDKAQTEQWKLTYSADNNNFSVSGSVSGDQDSANINERYDNGIISFTIRNGSTAWQDGDIVLINCYKGTAQPFTLINSGVYRRDLKAELQGATDLNIQDNSGGNLDHTIDGKLNNHDYILSRADIRCDNIDTNHKFNKTDVAIHTSILSIPSEETSRIYLHNFTSDTVTSETTKSIDINLLHSYINICGTTVVLYDYTSTLTTYEQITHITFNITNSSGKVDIYINGDLYKSVTVNDLKNSSFRVYTIFLPAGVSLYTWGRTLTNDEIATIHNNNGFPTDNVANDYYSSLLNNQYFTPYFIVKPKNKFGFFHIDLSRGFIKYKNVLSAKWLPTITHIGSRFQAWDRYDETSNETYYPFVIQYLNLGEYDTILDKFWVVHDGESLLIVTKHFDPIVHSEPVYQLYYIGWTVGNNMYDFPIFIGMKSGAYNWWDTNHSDYRFGLTYNRNISVWKEVGWYNGFVKTTQMSSEWSQIQTTDNFTTIMRVHLYYDYGDNSTRQIPYGTPKWLYLINTFDVTSETSFYIDGIKYVVIPDNRDSGSNYNFLIELNKD